MSPKQIIISLAIVSLFVVSGIFFFKSASIKEIPVPAGKLPADTLLTKPNLYLGSDGQWHPIDPDIVKSDDANYEYMNVTNNFKTYFPDKINNSKDIKFQRADAWVNFNALSMLTVKKINDKNQEKVIARKTLGFFNSVPGQLDPNNKDIKNKLSYPKIYQNGDKFIDINYTIYSYKLSEEIVLNKFQDYPELTQHLTLHNAYAKVDGPLINFYHQKTGELLWFISSPKMYEQNDKTKLSHGLTYDIKCDNSRIPLDNCTDFTITKKFTDEGKKWLSDSNRQFPVVLDPDFQINSADNSTLWVSSDTTNFTVSQETTIKHEGTGSVKIVATGKCWQNGGVCSASCQYNALGTSITAYASCGSAACGGNCWGIAGACDAGCTGSGYTTGSVATSCGAGVLCAGSNCWGIGGTCDAGCTNQTYTTGTIKNTCGSGVLCAGTNCWGVSAGSCDAGCTNLTYSTSTVANVCSGAVYCAGGYWGHAFGYNDSYCSSANVYSETIYTSCAQGTYCL